MEAPWIIQKSSSTNISESFPTLPRIPCNRQDQITLDLPHKITGRVTSLRICKDLCQEPENLLSSNGIEIKH